MFFAFSYGKWHYLYSTASGPGIDVKPGYEYLEIVKFGIYGLINNNNTKEIGKIILSKQDNIETIIQLFPDAEYRTDYQMIQKVLQFKGSDTLILVDKNIGGFGEFYKRVN